MPRKVIIDTDPGVDDAMAIFFALESPELEVIGLTTIFGNVHTDLATTNALRLLAIAERPDIPVAKGADRPIAAPYRGPVPLVHGEDGQGNVFLPLPESKPLGITAAEFIIEQVMQHPAGTITLAPIGPLTNIALALHLEPRIVERVHEVVLMGGSALGPGNASPAAEANIYNDPEAADAVFGAGWPLTMVGLDVTHKVHMTPEVLAHYGQSGSPMAQHISQIVPHYRGYFERNFPDLEGIYVHDSSAIAYLIDPSLFTVERWPVRVETQSISRGKTWPALPSNDFELLPPWQNRPLVNVCVDVDGPAVVELELSRLAGE